MPCLHGHYYPTMPTALVLLQIKKLPPTLIWYQNQNCGFPLINHHKATKIIYSMLQIHQPASLGDWIGSAFQIAIWLWLICQIFRSLLDVVANKEWRVEI